MKPKQIDGRYLEPIIGKRTARIFKKGAAGHLGISPMTTKIMAEGIRPSSVAAQYAEIIAHIDNPQQAWPPFRS